MAVKYADKPEWNGLYKLAAWLRLRLWHLRRNPLCVFCQRDGIVQAANTVDHIQPHKGDKKLFFDKNNLQSLCAPCHSRHKQSMERGGADRGCDENGIVRAWQGNKEP